ncbi:MAG: T9SS type A sorting domain-containing protein, partial [Candidatus Latescibacteria bacterium]|nr:T9SS type A sorting domain-containing protein [Candidatus Latescibacterota bacterium]
MKKLFSALCITLLVASVANAANFSPTLLRISADPVIQYDFDGSNLNIPFEVSGSSAGVILAVYTKGKAAEIPDMVNGFLGWHHVNKVDTCIYYSSLKSVGIGKNSVVWSGKDLDGGTVPPGDYTYYLWGFDNQGNKTKVSEYTLSRSCSIDVIELDESGVPMSNPLYYDKNGNRWAIGSDPDDQTNLMTCTITLAEGWSSMSTNYGACPAVHPGDYNFFYIEVVNTDSDVSAIQKFKYVPGGDAELQTDFGEGGYGGQFTGSSNYQPGVCTDGEYLYTGDQHLLAKTEPDADFYIIDFDGYMVDEVDLTPWWSSPEAYEAGAQMNGGPNGIAIRNGKCFLNCHCSCIKQMVDPIRFLQSGEAEDLFVWTNMNGDYVLDHNFEATANLKWICNDYNVGPYTYNLDADDMLFSACPAYDVGAVSFGLMGPDGTGIGYFAFSGETAGWKKGNFFIDSGTAFDGLYCDNDQTGGTHYEWDKTKRTPGTWFLGHDAITGTITNAVGVAEEAPAAFSVGQNAPNPFNPTTTITFSLAQSGDMTVDVFNVAGQKVDTLVDGFMEAGQHSVVWDASGFSAGVY